MRKALIVGIDYYPTIGNLSGCVNDAYSVKAALERHADGTINFPGARMMTATGPGQEVTKRDFKEAIRELFADDAEIALLYFAGHGFIDDTGGYLCGSDSESGDDGMPLADLMTLANSSRARNKLIILDSCHSGVTGGEPGNTHLSRVADGVTILTASTATQYAMETPGGGSGVFTNLFVDALNGAAANLVGDITPGSVYAHIDQTLGPWEQRPVFKTNVKEFVSVRRADPPIALEDLRALTRIFPTPDFRLPLDPSFEPERAPGADSSIPAPDPANTRTFETLQHYARVNLARPVDAPHMWHAAMENKSCELTVLGQHYWALVDNGRI